MATGYSFRGVCYSTLDDASKALCSDFLVSPGIPDGQGSFVYPVSCSVAANFSISKSVSFRPYTLSSGSYVFGSQSPNFSVSTSSISGLVSFPSCDLPGTDIPTVQDGVLLGWATGGAMILVACIIFITRVLKK